MEYSDSDETRSRLVSATAGLGPASAVFLPATVQRSTSALLLTHFPSPTHLARDPPNANKIVHSVSLHI